MEFNLETYGHPLAELSKNFTSEVNLSIKLTRKLSEKVFGDYLKRFGLEITSLGMSVSAPWSELIETFREKTAKNRIVFELSELDKPFEGTTYLLMKSLPENYQFLDFLANLPEDLAISKGYKYLELEKKGKFLLSKYDEGSISIPIAVISDETNNKNVLFQSYLISLLVDKLIGLEKKEITSPTLPISISPYQAVVLSVGNIENKLLSSIAEKLRFAGLSRVYIDDRPTKLGDKLREWGMKWVPLIFIFGEREKETGTVIVRHRPSASQFSLNIDDLEKSIKTLFY